MNSSKVSPTSSGNSRLPLRRNVPLAPLTTIKLGGPAAQFVECTSDVQLAAALRQAQAQQVPTHILGGGSNTIFADAGFLGLVIKISLQGISWQPQADGTTIVVARAGEVWDDVVAAAVARGLAGFECMSGIPGLLGATPMQNVGAYGQDVSQSIVSVTAFDRAAQKAVTFSNSECQFSYRSSRFKKQDRDTYVITDVTFQLQTNGSPTVTYPQLIDELGGEEAVRQLGQGRTALQAVREAVLAVRQRKSMVVNERDPHSRSCGSFFVNPLLTAAAAKPLQQLGAPLFPAGDQMKVPAAWLIEQAGFRKGYRRGSVGISANHPLALVNYGGTTAELLALADEIQQHVHAKFSITLAREPDLII